MTNAFIIGNGPSRLEIDLEALRPHGTIWGCNALFRDFSPDYLVAVDKTMQDEIISTNYTGHCYFKSHRNETPLPNVTYFTQTHSAPNNSGIVAIYYAMKTRPKNLYLIGFDLNAENIYKGTKNYAAKGKAPKRGVPERIKAWSDANHHIINFYRVLPVAIPIYEKLNYGRKVTVVTTPYISFSYIKELTKEEFLSRLAPSGPNPAINSGPNLTIRKPING